METPMESLLFATFGWGFAFAPLIWILVIVGIVLLVRGRGGGWDPPGSGPSRETAIDVLERRFAEGEISLEQYRERRAVLEEKP
jgi:putative membrane protein